MNKSSWYLIGGLAVLLLSIPAYVLYRSSHDMVETPDFSARRFWRALTLVSAWCPMKAHIIQALDNAHWTNDVSS